MKTICKKTMAALFSGIVAAVLVGLPAAAFADTNSAIASPPPIAQAGKDIANIPGTEREESIPAEVAQTEGLGISGIEPEASASTSDVTLRAAPEEFKIEVTVATGDTFYVPTAGLVTGFMSKSYAWDISWGDGSSFAGYTQAYNPEGKTPSENAYFAPGIPHTYAAGGSYIITITPNGSTEAWLASFGFPNSMDPLPVANKEMLTDILSEFTPLMTRTAAQVSGVSNDSRNEWNRVFENCTNLKSTGPGFSSDWDAITVVGYGFCSNLYLGCSNNAFMMQPDFNLPQNLTTFGYSAFQSMFQRCTGASFTMNEIFNLPSGFTVMPPQFAMNMFDGCNGAAFTMNDVFNLPPQITTVQQGLGAYMFRNCSGANFTMNKIFNLPQGVTGLWGSYAQEMFKGCSGAAFQINDVFRFPRVVQAEYNKASAVSQTFNSLNSSVPQKRSAVSIINNPSTITPPTLFPEYARNTFGGSSLFSDLDIIHANWGGTANAPDITITYNRNGMSEVVFPVEASGANETTLPALTGSRIGTPAIEYASSYTNHTWYTDPDCLFPWDFTSDVAATSMTLYAYKPAAPIGYVVIEHFGTYTGEGTRMAKVDADDTKFVALYLSGMPVPQTGYDITAGSTVISLKESYLKTFVNGGYVFTAEYTDGVATPINLTVAVPGGGGGTLGGNGAGPNGSPGTGDGGSAILPLMALLLTLSIVRLAARRSHRKGGSDSVA